MKSAKLLLFIAMLGLSISAVAQTEIRKLKQTPQKRTQVVPQRTASVQADVGNRQLTPENQAFYAENGIVRCATVEYNEWLREQYPNRSTEQEFEDWLAPLVEEYKTNQANRSSMPPVYYIPVIFHVITSGSGATNLSEFLINEQIDQLNIDLANMAGSSYGVAADAEIIFVPAVIDPLGNPLPEPGINRITTYGAGPHSDTYFDSTIKPNTIWDRTQYANVWTGNLSGLLGYAQFPDNSTLPGMPTDGGPSSTDGVVILHTSVGSVANPNPAGGVYAEGRTLTHEIGHWIGLRHIWGDGGCSVDDYCNDTPVAGNATSGCPGSKDSCSGGGPDMIENYMDYSYDSCMDTFTADQVARMRTVMENSPGRLELPNSPALGNQGPEIAFTITDGTVLEGTACGTINVNVPLSISAAPSADATVTFTATDGTATSADYGIVTSSIVFPAGSTADQNFTFSLEPDGWIESDETFSINFTVSTAGDAEASLTANTLNVTIENDDSVPFAGGTGTLLFEDFEAPSGWSIIDNDGDGNNWTILGDQGWTPHQYSGNWAASFSWDSVPLSPDNFIISPAFTIPPSSSAASVSYIIGSGDDGTYFKEHYSVYFTTDASSVAAITAGVVLENDREVPANGTELRSHDLTAYAGQTGYFVVRHHNVTDEFILGLDNVEVTYTASVTVQTTDNSADPYAVDIFEAGTVHPEDPNSGDDMATLVNATSFDYGCTAVAVTREGSSAQGYNGSTGNNRVTDKRYSITTTNTTATGNTDISFFFTEAEIAGWETTTGNDRANLYMAREVGGAIVELVPATIGSIGTEVSLNGSFSAFEGDYYFGLSTAFGSCIGTTTYSGGSWDNGAPDATMTAIIEGNYSTASSNLKACELFVNSGSLTIPAATYAQVQNNITVASGATVTIEHEGSLVQIDDAATVINNGTISVLKNTPMIGNRGFMIVSSPMTAETRNGVHNTAIQVRNHITANFTPNSGVASAFPAAENFADDNGDNWQQFSGTLSAGEGFLVMPQATPTIGAPSAYTFNYSQGTLNNGVVNFNVAYNGTQNASPNILGNPYASAIDADVFLAQNSMIDVLYFWEHLSEPTSSYPGYNAHNYSMGDISMYNGIGGVAAANGGSAPTQYVASGQGFATKVTTSGTAVFNNSMRVTGNNDQYRIPDNILERLWLEVDNTTYNLRGNTLIGFTDAATDGFDSSFDANRLPTPISLYSYLETGEELGIQGRGVFEAEDEVMLGFSTQIEEDAVYRIRLGAVEGIHLETASIYLIDHLQQTVTPLTSTDYEFVAKEGDYKGRFTLVFKAPELNIENNALNAIAVFPNPFNSSFTIASPTAAIEEVEVRDVQGRLVFQTQIEMEQNVQLTIADITSGVYFIHIKTIHGNIVKRLVRQ
ncbi:M43 family zinc metalloprotease [Flavobacteriaceae bacterium TK19130]|nr:M43 family zinc metalloprotease [Thermobacterium salinum]